LDIFGNGYGVSIGYFIPSSSGFINSFLAEPPMFPAIGLILMMYPPLTKIDFSKIPLMFESLNYFTASFTWIIGPFLMFSLATFF
jgi:ACR3 family arsenite transporter